MGYGNYSREAHELLIRGRAHVPNEQVFKQQRIHPLMDPKGVKVRECRDGAEHPQSLGIVFALDVTGSMGAIPRLLAKEQLPTFMQILGACGVRDPQILFLAVGDATTDHAPLQVGHFETTAELMDQWLTRSWLEGNGGGNAHESYELALYFLAQHTEMDCWVKRKKRGFLFMTGDELPYETLSKNIAEAIVGDRLDGDLKLEEIVAELQKTFVPFFIIPDAQRRAKCEGRWRQVLGDNVLCADDPKDIVFVAAGALLLSEGLVKDGGALVTALQGAGLAPDRTGHVMKTLAPLAELHGAVTSSAFQKILGSLFGK
jgi:hypothetical protein